MIRRQELQIARAKSLSRIERANAELRALCIWPDVKVPTNCRRGDSLPAMEGKIRSAEQPRRKTVIAGQWTDSGAVNRTDECSGRRCVADADCGTERKVELLTDQRQKLGETIGTEEAELRKWDGNGLAGEAAERAAAILADLRDAAGEYARLKLASGILKRGIERYGQRKRGPVLDYASRLFSTLTLGSFKGLELITTTMTSRF